MNYVLLSLIGIIGGVIGGMGMGGGTLLIPMLSVFMGINQISSQAINLVAFIPMSIVSLSIHIKNKKVIFKNSQAIIMSGILTSIFGAILAKRVQVEILKKCFGLFLLCIVLIKCINLFLSKLKK